MIKLACPACGAEIQFKSSVSIFGVCSFCNSMVVRHDMDLESLGKMATLPPDMSVLQIGTRGRYLRTNFEIVGRLRMAWDDGFWNEWYVLFDDGKDGWLAEAQGFYMMSFKMSYDEIPAEAIPSVENIFPGRVFMLLKDENFEVDDIKSATCVGSEGELPMKAPQGRKSVSVDLSGNDNKFANLDYSTENTRLYVGRYVNFDDLELTSLREIDGW